ncbi:hypothetical protein JJL45_05160 [Tamlana sp. s12]|uniref:hypothetical protein n=1 Tax=Tamlana sp. s12 TaxID=1630406 RepID=UPI0007FD6DA6|nr:hypothetical protein [Tamlana sp. s12]OBQ56107.1 hypothetical protein VQ01_06900 [Tamlana sp. s12]QQY83380.1 hypothetical protein JJL45_05160 [Tamlana sp. s12]
MEIEFTGKNAIVHADNIAFSYEVTNNPRDFELYRGTKDSLEWDHQRYFVGEYIIHPYGDANNLPTIIKDVVLNNHLAPGSLNKQANMLWGKGPKLYKETFKDGELVYEWQEDKEIQAWLDSWDYEDYCLRCVVDFNYLKGVFTKFYLRRGNRDGSNKGIAKLEHVLPDTARLASHITDKDIKDPSHIIITDWAFKNVDSILKSKAYYKFDPLKPFAHKNAVFYSNMYTFCTEYYSIPEIYGALEWIKQSTAVPLIFKALSENSINLKYHIQSPQYFWDVAESKIKDACTLKGENYQDSMLLEYQKKYLQKITSVLSGAENVGKFLHTTLKLEVDGTNLLEHGWKIEKIDQNVKDFIEAQIKVSERADHVLTGSLGVHSALANVGQQGKSDSGSEQYQALNGYLATSVDIPEMIALKAINYAIKVNFPNKKLKLGFYHLGTKKMEDTTPKERNPQL